MKRFYSLLARYILMTVVLVIIDFGFNGKITTFLIVKDAAGAALMFAVIYTISAYGKPGAQQKTSS